MPPKLWQEPFKNEGDAVKDLAALAALAAYRRLAPQTWAGLVMKDSPEAMG
jgi:nitrogen regulatory protein PII-like uncharacterized protein